jgi:hypothetical protein
MRILLSILLLFGAFASPNPQDEDPCRYPPPTRLAVGDRAEVSAGIDRLRLRILPAVGTGELGLLYAGTQMTVLAGPSCNGGYLWWRVELDDGTHGWVAEGSWSTYYLSPVERTLCTLPDAPWLRLIVAVVCPGPIRGT